MANHFLSKQAHMHHHAKMQLEDLGRRLIGGTPLAEIAEEHQRIERVHQEADETDNEFLCIFGHTFVPAPPPNNTEIRIFARTVILPGGDVVRSDVVNGMVMEIPIAICDEHGAAAAAKAVTHDWSETDHRGQPLNPKSETEVVDVR